MRLNAKKNLIVLVRYYLYFLIAVSDNVHV